MIFYIATAMVILYAPSFFHAFVLIVRCYMQYSGMLGSIQFLCGVATSPFLPQAAKVSSMIVAKVKVITYFFHGNSSKYKTCFC